MGLDTFIHDRLVAVRLRSPKVETSRAIIRVVEQRREQIATELCFVLIIGTDCPMPTPDQRRQLAHDLTRLRSCCADTRTLVLGRELRQALVRSLVTGFAMLPGGPRPQVHGSVPELLAALEQSLDIAPTWLGTQLIDAGLITAREASWTNQDQFVS